VSEGTGSPAAPQNNTGGSGFLETLKGKILAITGVVVALGGLWAAIQGLIPKHESPASTSSSSAAEESKFPSEKDTALQVASGFLAVMDQNRYGDGWEFFDPDARSMDKTQWSNTSTQLRGSRGTVQGRQLLNDYPAVNPPGWPPGKYTTLTYRSAFTLAPQTTEVLILKLNSLGHWRMYGYNIQ
jgi:hypothetical protein